MISLTGVLVILIADDIIRSATCSQYLSYLALARMILGYKYVKGYRVDEERACMLGEVDPTPTERIKSVTVASRMIDRDDYLIPCSRISGRRPPADTEVHICTGFRGCLR